MDVRIKEVGSLRELKSFIRFPNILYRNNPYRVPPLFFDEYRTLRKDKNPAFEHCKAKYWLVYSNNGIVGRIAGIINRLRNEKWTQRYLEFGWIDFIDDETVSEALLHSVETWGKKMGMTTVHGPLGFTDFDQEGMLVEGFDELGTLATIYNYPYYPKHIEKLGYRKDVDWLEYELMVPPVPDETVARIAEIVMHRYKLKKLNVKQKKDYLPYAHELFKLINTAYRNLYGFVPLTDRQIDIYVKQYFGFIRPEFVPIVLDRTNSPVAFGVTMPSLTRALQKAKGKLFPSGWLHLLKALRTNNRADLYLVAVRPEFQGKGVNAILINEMNKVFNKYGIKIVESNPELETNRLVQEQWKFFEKRQHKRRRCYIKELS
jgi:hypothetical protein